MASAERCECEATSILVFPCSGGSNVGQIANAAAVELNKQGRATMYCLAGMGAHVAGMVDSAAGAQYRIAIDGCKTACARKTLEHAGVPVEQAVVITDLGVSKNHDFVWSEETLAKVIEAACAKMPPRAAPEGDSAKCGCGCK